MTATLKVEMGEIAAARLRLTGSVIQELGQHLTHAQIFVEMEKLSNEKPLIIETMETQTITMGAAQLVPQSPNGVVLVEQQQELTHEEICVEMDM